MSDYLSDVIIGNSVPILEVLSLVSKAAKVYRTTVLILGETGSGKGAVARRLHLESPRCKGPFIKVNCAAIPDTLVESELFGHVKGAFTDAKTNQPGLFELAEGGTLFLDEIGDLPLGTQPKILAALEDQEIRPVGGAIKKKVNVRVIAGTNKNLKREVERWEFRADLYFRLAVLTITIPPLRERREDIPLIAEHLHRLVRSENNFFGSQVISQDALFLLQQGHSWPGNVRELRNAIESAVILNPDEPELTAKFFPDIISILSMTNAVVGESSPQSFKAMKRKLAREAVARHKGNKTHAAEELEISRHTLRVWLEGSPTTKDK